MAVRILLIWKFLAVQIGVIAAVIVAVWLSFDFLAADYFMQLMKKFPEIDTKEVNEMFLSASQRSLLIVGAAAFVVSGLLGYWLTRRILSPLHQINLSTQRIAVGDYDCRVEPRTRDELADLATSFNRMAKSLSHNEQLRKSMVVDVAHELRTPLTNLRGFIEALQDGIVEPTERVLRVLHDELLRLVRLTEDLLQAARGGERQERRRRPVAVVSLLAETLELFRPRFLRRGIDVQTELTCEAQEVLADADQIKQVFGNLLQNCLQYAPQNSWTKILAVERDDRLRLVFSNPGEGIDAKELPLIFEPYYRVDKSRSRNSGGAGIGLAIVQSLVESHGGTVGASSGPDVTRIWVELPRPAG